MAVLPTRRALLVALLLALGLAACGSGSTTRQDLVLVLADTAEGAGPVYTELAAGGLVLHGGLRRDETPLPTPLELRIELFTSRRDPGFLDTVHPSLPALPSAVARSGRRALGFSTPTGLVEGADFERAFDQPGLRGVRNLERLPATAIPAAARAAFDELVGDAASRAPALLLVDLAGGVPEDLDALLDAFAPELRTAHLFVYFTDPLSPDRLLLHGPGLPVGDRNDPVDPRDLFPTAAYRARTPVPGPVQGIDLLR